MSFLFPAFLLGAAAIALPIVLHVLRRNEAPDVPFTAVKLLNRSPLDGRRRRRMQDWILLAARVAALLLLAAAFARPYLQSAGNPSLRVVAVDRSYSMGAPGTFERTLAMAREAVDAAARGERVAIVAFDDRAELIAPPGGRAEAQAALAGLQPGFGDTRYAPAVRMGVELAGGADARLILVTDMQRSGWAEEEPPIVPDTLRIEVREVAGPAGNLAVTHVRRTAGGAGVGIRNSGAHPGAGTARLLLDGVAVASTPFNVPAGERVDVQIAHKMPERGAAVVQIDDEEGYPADNSRHLVLDPPARGRILVAGADAAEPAFYVTRALTAGEVVEGVEIRGIPAAALGRDRPEEMSESRAVVLLSTRNLDRRGQERLAEFVRAGGGLLVAAGSEVDPGVLGTAMGWPEFSAVEEAAGASRLAATDLRHPIFRAFGPLAANLGQVRFTHTWRVRAAEWQVMARFTDGAPALLERQEGAGRVVLFASDLERRWNDFPLHPSFVPFTVEAVRYIAIPAGAKREYLVADAPPDTGGAPGVHFLEGTGDRVAVNVDTRESSPAGMSGDEFMAMLRPDGGAQPPPAHVQAEQTEARQGFWRYGLLLMLGALVAESFVGRR
ncbi:MAG: BatA domain-containing protein [Acidobacteria bacterium]|nr:BatA domain-containing protein [Acidobacteriota bacterium]